MNAGKRGWRDGLVAALAVLVEDVDLVPRTFIRRLKPSVTPILGWFDTFLDSVDTGTRDVHIHILRHTHKLKKKTKLLLCWGDTFHCEWEAGWERLGYQDMW